MWEEIRNKRNPGGDLAKSEGLHGNWLQDRKITAHEQLYQDATRRQERQLTYAAWIPDDVTFAPKIIRRAPETGKVSEHPGRKSTGNLAERWASHALTVRADFPHSCHA